MEREGLLVDRGSFVLVIIDIQERLAAAMDRRDEVVENVMRLAKTAKIVGAPIIVTRQYPRGLGDTVPELQETLVRLESAEGGVHRIDKVSFCCSSEPAFLQELHETGRTQAVLTGMETHICVAQTALDLLSKDFGVFTVADACCSRRDYDHEVALERLRAAGVSVLSTESVMYEAVGVAGTDEFRALLRLVKGEE